jgi:hypothetical protein
MDTGNVKQLLAMPPARFRHHLVIRIPYVFEVLPYCMDFAFL